MTTPTTTRRRVEPRHWALLALLAATALLYLWNLSRNGWGNEFYAAAAQAGGESWKAWLFGSLDKYNVITVDKPPAALWLTGLSVRIFGLSSWSMLAPQALAGVASVGVLYATVRRLLLGSGSASSATAGGLLAGALLALTPAAVLMFRFNNPDALLVLLMTVAAYCTVRACQQASAKWLALCGVALGFAFLTKMLQGLIVVPGFGLAYLLFAQTTWGKRVRDLVLAVVALVVSAGWYVALVDLWPASSRPYIGGSEGNSFMNLVLGYNGFARIFGHGGGRGGGMGGGGGFPGGGMTPPEGMELPGGMGGPGGPGGMGGRGGAFGGKAGITRLFSGEFGNEISWLLPAALLVVLVGLVLAALRLLPATRARFGATWTVNRDIAMGVTVFGTWLVINGLVFAYMTGIVHPYYTVALAPPIAALVAIGAVVGWRHRTSWAGTGFLALLLTAAVGWGIARAHATGFAWPVLGWVLGIGLVVGLAALVALRRVTGTQATMLTAYLTILGPLATASFGIATANTTHTGAVPTAVHTTKGGSGMGFPGGTDRPFPPNGATATDGTDRPFPPAEPGDEGARVEATPNRHNNRGADRGGFGGMGGMGAAADKQVVELLKQTTTQWAAATTGAMSQGSLQLESRRPVIALGGFSGGDPAPSLAQFQEWVREGKIGYYVVGGGPGGMRGDRTGDRELPDLGGSRVTSEIEAWVKENFTATIVGNTTVYKLT